MLSVSVETELVVDSSISSVGFYLARAAKRIRDIIFLFFPHFQFASFSRRIVDIDDRKGQIAIDFVYKK